MLFDLFSPDWIKKLFQLLTKFEINWSSYLFSAKSSGKTSSQRCLLSQGLDVSSRTEGYYLGSLTNEEHPQVFLGLGTLLMYLQGLAGHAWPLWLCRSYAQSCSHAKPHCTATVVESEHCKNGVFHILEKLGIYFLCLLHFPW